MSVLGAKDAAHSSKSPTVSVVVPSYQASGHIRSALQSLAAQVTDVTYEVIVVDSSTDGTHEIVEREFPQVRLLHFAKRCQVGTARNIGIEAALGEVILFSDSDTVVNPTWLDQMYHALSDGGTDGVGGSMSNGTPGNLTGSVGFYLEFFRFLEFDGDPHPTRFLVGGNSGFHRNVLKSAVYLDHSTGEDMLLSAQLAQQGRKLLFLPRAAAKHLNRTGFVEVFRYQHKLGQGAYLYRSFATPEKVRVLQALPPMAFLMPLAIMPWIAGTLLRRKRYADLLRFAALLPVCFAANMAWAAGFHQALRHAQREHPVHEATVAAESINRAD
jgi:glycosyltransferase involved in cell wall biosynthesis